MNFPGIIDAMEHRTPAPVHQHRHYFFGTFIGTVLWVLPLMALLMCGGYLLAERYVGPTYLQPSAVSVDRPQPIRILSPSEAAAVARDEPSHVWTEGVRPSDIPKMDTPPPVKRAHAAPKKSASTTPAPGKSDATAAPAKPETPAAPDTSPADAGTPSPAPDTPAPDQGTDNGDTVSPD